MGPSEEQLLFRPNTEGQISVCLAYPNSYPVAMGNLGYQAVYRILATTPGVACERLCLPEDGSSGRTLESGRWPGDFDLIAFSVSFESDYPNIVRMLSAAGVPARRRDRDADGNRDWPLVIGGGPAVFLNPEPIAAFFDLFLVGEAEEMLPEAFAGARGWSGRERTEVLDQLSSVVGAYRPGLYQADYGANGELVSFEPQQGATATVTRRYLSDLDRYPATTTVVAPGAVFGDQFMVEASRGCEWGCRFCAAGFMYRPVRHRSADGVAADALAGLERAPTIGLVGAEMASHPGLAGTCEKVADAGGRVSPSSLKADVISPRLARALARGLTRSVTVAPEAGSERMRRVINKNLDDNEIMRATDLLVGDGVESLKLYFMCGLPTETDEDLDGIAGLTARIRDRVVAGGRSRGRVGRIKVSINPFVPKPWTPFQWDPMVEVAELQKRMAGLRRSIGRIPNVQMETESPREAYLQALFSRGDRRVASVVEALATSESWWQDISAMRRGEHPAVQLDLDRYVTGSYEHTSLLPWDFIDHHIERDYLWLERRRAFAERETEPCDVATCHSCGAC